MPAEHATHHVMAVQRFISCNMRNSRGLQIAQSRYYGGWTKTCMTLRNLNYGNYGTFLILGNAGFCPSTVCIDFRPQSRHYLYTWSPRNSLTAKSTLSCRGRALGAPVVTTCAVDHRSSFDFWCLVCKCRKTVHFL